MQVVGPTQYDIPGPEDQGMTGQLEEQERYVDMDGRTACVSLEGEFWDCLDEIATRCDVALGRLLTYVGGDADDHDLSGLLRVFVLTFYRNRAGLFPICPDPPYIDEGLQYKLLDKKSYH
jgi:predicted DNA-binding ribbon-helix-helix protein